MVDGDFVAELATLGVADNEDGFVSAKFAFAGDEHQVVVHVRWHWFKGSAM